MCNRVFCWVDRAVSIGIWAQKSPLFVKPVPWLYWNSFSEIYTIAKQAKIIFTKICKVFLWFNICGGVRLHFKCKVSEEERTWVSQNLEPKNQVLHCFGKNLGTGFENHSKSLIFYNLYFQSKDVWKIHIGLRKIIKMRQFGAIFKHCADLIQILLICRFNFFLFTLNKKLVE